MKKLIRHIEFLLQSHDCVILPGLGAILAHGSAAYYDDLRGLWNPPCRVYSFNPTLSRTDGLLASSVARRDNIGMDAAAAVVRTGVEQMKAEYDQKGILSLGSVGRLSRNDQGSMIFEPSPASWLSPGYLWLDTLAIKPLAGISQYDQDYVAELRHRDRWQMYLRRFGQVAACFAVVLALGWLVNSTLSDAPSQQLASVAPTIGGHQNTIAQDQPNENPSTLVLVVNRQEESADAVEPVSKEVAVNKVTTEVVNKSEDLSVVADQVRIDASDKYFVIVASLSSFDEAQQYLRQHDDIKLGILTTDGRFRIYAASGQTYNEACAAIATPSIANRYADAWVCRR